MPDIVLVILAVIFVLGVAINIHEFGHFIVAKLLGMRVEAYSFFGLGPRIWGFKVGHTDYRISAIPLGAYVKLYGDEATAALEGGESDGEKVPDSELYELRPRWQKFLVMVGGPFMNIVLALGIPIGLALSMGVPAVPEPVVGFVVRDGAGEKAGIKPGDRIVAIDDVNNPTWDEIRDNGTISADRDLHVTVQRDGAPTQLTVRPEAIKVAGNSLGDLGIEPDIGEVPVVVQMVAPGKPAAEAGILPNDRVVAYQGRPVRNSQELTVTIREARDAQGTLTIERNGSRQDLPITAIQDADGIYRIGVQFDSTLGRKLLPVGIAGAVGYAVSENLRILKVTGKVLGQMFTGQRGVKDAGLSGPVGIVRTIASATSGDHVMLKLVSLLMVISLSLGVFNLLPIPLLDGGQILVLGIEKVMSWFGATLSMAVREYIQYAGLGIILLLMVFTLFLDISKLF